MDEQKKFFSFMKQKLHKTLIRNNMLNISDTTEKLPPRFPFRGLTMAAQVMRHEIRDFISRNTGKDLAKLQEYNARQRFLENISKLKATLTSSEAKHSYLLLAYNHNSNFTSSLSPDAEYCIEYNDFEKNSFRKFIADYHKRCLQVDRETQSFKRKSKLTEKKREIKNTTSIKDTKSRFCTCNSPVDKNIEKISYLNCWIHYGIKEEYLDDYCKANEEYFSSRKGKDADYTEENWSEFIRTKNCRVFRKLMKSGIYEYRVQATYVDVSANNLFRIQTDGDYRKNWDEYIIDFKVIDKDESSDTELVHWITRCPYPFATRDYVYLRRKKVDNIRKMLVLYQQATDDSNIPSNENVQRVDTYLSKIIIKPHNNSFEEDGCDFLLTYYDDPKMMLPRRIMDIAASKGIKDSLDKMHSAAQKLKKD